MSALCFAWPRRANDGAQKVLELEGLTVRVGIRPLLTGINLVVREGDWVLLTGPNGSGKTTLLNAISGVAPAKVETGRIRLLGLDVTNFAPHTRAALGLAYLPQLRHVFPSLTIAENLRVSLGPYAIQRFREAFPTWDDQLPLGRLAGSLSGGEKKKLAWAMTTLRDAKLFLLDEVDAGVAERLVPRALSTCLSVTHQPGSYE